MYFLSYVYIFKRREQQNEKIYPKYYKCKCMPNDRERRRLELCFSTPPALKDILRKLYLVGKKSYSCYSKFSDGTGAVEKQKLLAYSITWSQFFSDVNKYISYIVNYWVDCVFEL